MNLFYNRPIIRQGRHSFAKKNEKHYDDRLHTRIRPHVVCRRLV